jgi:adenylate cyclase
MRANDIDVMRDAMLHGTHAQALWLSGRPRDALRIVETALGFMVSSESRTDREDAGFDFRRLIGFDPGHWLHAQQARLLVWLGRFAEAEAAIDDLERMEASVGEVAVVKFIPHLAAAEMGFWTANAKLAKRHADLLADYSDRVRLPYLRVAALFADGLASSARSDFTRAASSLREALSFARSSNAGLEFEPLMQSVHAEATYRKGAAAEAAALARDAIAVSQQRTNRIAECHASLTWAAAMLEAGAGGSVARTEPLLARAEELIEESGAVILEPLLRQVLSSRDRLS